jgi:hypothetical protein
MKNRVRKAKARGEQASKHDGQDAGKALLMIEKYPEAENYEGKEGGDKKSLSVTANDRSFSWAMVAEETGRPPTRGRVVSW